MELKAPIVSKVLIFVLIQVAIINVSNAQKINPPISFEDYINLEEKAYPRMNVDSPFFFKEKPFNEDEDHCYKVLGRFLYEDIPIPSNFKKTIGYELFIFRVNQYGEIDVLETFGNLDSTIKQKIVSNIYKTQGRWTLPKKKSKPQQRYFLYGFSIIEDSKLPTSKLYLYGFLNKSLGNITNKKKSNIIILPEGSLFNEMVRKGMISVEEL